MEAIQSAIKVESLIAELLSEESYLVARLDADYKKEETF